MTPADTRKLPRIGMVMSSMFFQCPEIEIPEICSIAANRTDLLVLLREKQLPANRFLQLAGKTGARLVRTNSLFMINERSDIALLSGAQGVHLPEEGAPLEATSAMIPGGIMGKSVHSVKSASSAEAEGADYLFFGPIYDTPLKRPYGPPQGVSMLNEVSKAVDIPVFAIGGITPETAQECLDAGAYGIAAMSLFTNRTTLLKILDDISTMLTRYQ
ncbi:thiamine phosphate synthase [Prosthecochloris vibrioformis]|uniref:Thiamine phosphate synthase n=1 Tax=Prosthecochloris vibrioformis TaxID=1098 RepID=A0A5C4S1S8_PROVB|nr:thiamine phosphate synthase [Prosthecochloris vibrioformis]TNJ37072.1 thiamine phosphate synthase [Prosthecochloris vibrioformis]